jgi:nucleoside-diphosphate-sugar epimerase
MSVEINAHARLILVTGAAGAVGSIGRNLTQILLAKGHKVRALVRREDGRAEALRAKGCARQHRLRTHLVDAEMHPNALKTEAAEQ